MPQIQCSHQHLCSICDSRFFICATQIGDILKKKKRKKNLDNFPLNFFSDLRKEENAFKKLHTVTLRTSIHSLN